MVPAILIALASVASSAVDDYDLPWLWRGQDTSWLFPEGPGAERYRKGIGSLLVDLSSKESGVVEATVSVGSVDVYIQGDQYVVVHAQVGTGVIVDHADSREWSGYRESRNLTFGSPSDARIDVDLTVGFGAINIYANDDVTTATTVTAFVPSPGSDPRQPGEQP